MKGPEGGLSTAVLAQMHAAVRALQVYPAENEAVRRSLQDLQNAAARMFEKEGGLSVWLAASYIFVNDLQVRLDLSDYAALSALRARLRAHGIGRIDVSPRVAPADWKAFVSELAADPTPGQPPIEAFRARLSEAQVSRITVGPPSPMFEGQEGVDAVEAARRTYAYSVKVAREMMSGVVLGKAIGARRAERAVLRIVDQVLQDRASMLGMLTLRDYDDHSLVHAVNVAILSVALGDHLGFPRHYLFELGFAALFHDIGKVLIPTGVLNKQGWLSDEEWRLVSQHPDFGLLLLFSVEGFEEPPYRAMLAAYEHHMKTDLSGYPRVIRRRRQGLFARILAITESYDAAISRFSKQFMPTTPEEVIRQLRDSESGAYDRVLVRAFVNLMGVYPVGTLVILDSGEMAVVVAPNPDPRAMFRPIVRIVTAPDGRRLSDGAVRDLTELDPETGRPRRSVVRSTDPERYGIRVADYVA
jgi:HD-GYP domain-containing protein (c-di-GMP phosphodiesterase class II)